MIVEWREVRPRERLLLAQVLSSPAPSSAPAMMSTTLSIAKPVAHAASPGMDALNENTPDSDLTWQFIYQKWNIATCKLK